MSATEARPLLHGLSKAQLAIACAELGQPAFRADQVWKWLYSACVSDWSGMRNLPSRLTEELSRRFAINPVTPVEVQGGPLPRAAQKILFRLRDGECVESVLIPAKGRLTLCVSSQVGCKFRCAFCASGQGGFKRNLEAGEMAGQAAAAGSPAIGAGAKPSHIVLMGMGEPLDNYDQALAAIRIINDGEGLAIGARRITISTCGLVPGILRLKDEGLQVELSVSLHAPDDALRSRLMPVNKLHPLGELMGACRAYTSATGRIITFEYTLIAGVNDSERQARELVSLLRGLRSRVNLIPLSRVDEFEGGAPDRAAAEKFRAVLNRAGINATMRASKGSALNAACGQLRIRTGKTGCVLNNDGAGRPGR